MKKLGGHIALGLSVHRSVCQAFETSHSFGNMYAKILKFYIFELLMKN